MAAHRQRLLLKNSDFSITSLDFLQTQKSADDREHLVPGHRQILLGGDLFQVFVEETFNCIKRNLIFLVVKISM